MNQKKAESLKEDYQYTMERMEDVLDTLEECIKKADEGVKGLTTASQQASKFLEKLEELRESVKDQWSAL